MDDKERHDGVLPVQQPAVGEVEVELERCEQETTGNKGDEQAAAAFARILARRAPAEKGGSQNKR